MLRPLFFLTALTVTAATAHAQWTLHDAHTTADLRGIDNVGHGVAWASGSNGTILRTEDAGFVWQLCAKPPNGEHLDFRAIQAFDNNTAIIMSIGKGDQSRLYKTTDGCQSWKLLFTNPDPDGFWDALQFVPPPNPGAPSSTGAAGQGGVSRVAARDPDHRYGILLGDPVNGQFSIFETQDGGLHWAKQRNVGLVAPLGGGVFAASNSSLLQHDGAQVFGTGGPQGAFAYYRRLKNEDCPPEVQNRDDCKSMWNSVLMPPGIRGPASSRVDSTGVFSLAVRPKGSIDASVIVAVGGDYKKPDDSTNTAAFTADSGQTWTAATTPPHGFRSAVAYDKQTKTWITVGPNGTDISTDDGRNWHPLHPNPAFNEPPDADQHWNALSLPYVVGPHGRIATLRPSALSQNK